jgi:hypothetical protein
MNPPKRGKKYKEIVERGCGGYQTWEGDYDCRHPYDWACDDCPCCIEYQKELWKKEKKIMSISFEEKCIRDGIILQAGQGVDGSKYDIIQGRVVRKENLK